VRTRGKEKPWSRIACGHSENGRKRLFGLCGMHNYALWRMDHATMPGVTEVHQQGNPRSPDIRLAKGFHPAALSAYAPTWCV